MEKRFWVGNQRKTDFGRCLQHLQTVVQAFQHPGTRLCKGDFGFHQVQKGDFGLWSQERRIPLVGAHRYNQYDGTQSR